MKLNKIISHRRIEVPEIAHRLCAYLVWKTTIISSPQLAAVATRDFHPQPAPGDPLAAWGDATQELHGGGPRLISAGIPEKEDITET